MSESGRQRNRPDVQLSLNIRGMRPSPTVAINERCDRLRREGRSVFKLGLGQSPFPVPTPVVDALRLNASRKDYLPVKGLPELREAVASYHARQHGLSCSADNVLIGPGSKELMFLLQVVYYGDLIVPTPAWVSYAPQARIVGRPVHFPHTRAEDGWRLRPEALEALCREDPGRPRVVILNYPSNPTGSTYSEAELEALAEVAHRYRLVLLSDEIYGELHYEGRHVSVARFYPEGTILSSGLSKWCGAGGWRLGTFTFPPALDWLLEAMSAVASETYTSTSAPIQYAAVKAFEGGIRIERYLWDVRRILRALGQELHERLTRCGLQVLAPEGGFYLFPDFTPYAEVLAAAKGIRTSGQLCESLLSEAGVAVLPGSDFGRDPAELTARIAYVDFDGARALAAAETIPRDAPLDDEFLETYCGSMLRAAEGIESWLRGLGAA